jgi:hypothetical protein
MNNKKKEVDRFSLAVVNEVTACFNLWHAGKALELIFPFVQVTLLQVPKQESSWLQQQEVPKQESSNCNSSSNNCIN